MTTLVSARGIGKRYLIGAEGIASLSLRDRISDAVRSLGKRAPRVDPREFWALREVGFDLERGHVLGVIGKNGAGKSTLLKIISEITDPTEGEAHLYGRVASLLEVGIGFHPELSGRENVFLNGAILGMPRAEIRRKFDEIVAFAEVERFIDTPVKRYSSGMYVRLAFSVAAHLEPDVLIVDEVLAVGDAAFQRKCLGKMEGMSTQGRAVLVVTHNMSIVTQLCDRVLWLDHGLVVEEGPTARVVSHYLSEGLTDESTWRPPTPASEDFEYHSIAIDRADGEPSDGAIPANVGVDIVFDFTVKGKLPPGRVAIKLLREDAVVVFTSSSSDGTPRLNDSWALGHRRLICHIPGNLLAPGKYFLSVSEPTPEGNLVHESVLSFTVSEQNSLAARDYRQGILMPLLCWDEETA